MRALRYICVGRYGCERQTYNADRVLSVHRARSAAWRAADQWQGTLGGCEGSDALARVYVREDVATPQELRDAADEVSGDSCEHEGRRYVAADFWADHEVVVQAGGLGLRVR